MEIPELTEQEALDLQDYYDGQLRHMEQEATPTEQSAAIKALIAISNWLSSSDWGDWRYMDSFEIYGDVARYREMADAAIREEAEATPTDELPPYVEPTQAELDEKRRHYGDWLATDAKIDELLRRLKPELFHGFAMMFQPEYRQAVRDWLSTL